MQWIFNTPPVDEWLEGFCSRSGLHPIMARLLADKGFESPQDLECFLFPKLADVEMPESIENLQQAIEIVDYACKHGQSIAVVSDYDVDGVTSMALLHCGFKALNFSFTHFFPNREREGYGLTVSLAQRILATEQHFDVLVSLDCGTNSLEAIQLLQKNGMCVIVVDHHRSNGSALPDAVIVNPHVHPGKHSESSKQLCTVGLVFKWLHLWLKRLKAEHYEPAMSIKLKPFLDLVALGTIADIVPLSCENRIFVHFGLRQMACATQLGLSKLIHVSGINTSKPIISEDVAFQLAPRINASGRLGSAEVPFSLLTSTDEKHCTQTSLLLDDINKKRQEIEKCICAEAELMMQQNPKRYAYVLFQPSWHIGVVGIVAGRLSRKYNCPTFVLGEQNGKLKGSGRGIPSVNLVELLTAANGFMDQWGGHPGAVGLSLEKNNLVPLEHFFNQYLMEKFPHGLPEAALKISATIQVPQISEKFMDDLALLEPFGQENEKPVFVIPHVIFREKPECFGQNRQHIRFKVGNILVIGWHFDGNDVPIDRPLDIAVQFSWNYWQSHRSIQALLVDWKTV